MLYVYNCTYIAVKGPFLFLFFYSVFPLRDVANKLREKTAARFIVGRTQRDYCCTIYQEARYFGYFFFIIFLSRKHLMNHLVHDQSSSNRESSQSSWICRLVLQITADSSFVGELVCATAAGVTAEIEKEPILKLSTT